MLRREGIASVQAVRERRIHPIDEAYLGRPGPRVLEGVRRMKAVIGVEA